MTGRPVAWEHGGGATLFAGGRVIDPSTGTDAVGDLRVADGRIAERAPRRGGRERVIDARGLVLAPAFVDPHVHFREPGDGRSETIASGLAAAARGGYADVFAMANTDPVNDTPAVTEAMLRAARASGSPVRLHPVSAATRGLLGRDRVALAPMKRAGARAVSDDGKPILDDAIMEAVLGDAAALGLPVFSHCETPALHPGGVAHDGAPARSLGLPGIPAESEAALVRRDLALAERTGAPVHLCHVSTAAAVDAIRSARARGVPVTAEAAPHHLLLSDEEILRLLPDGAPDAHLKMNPPLRSAADRAAVRAALRDGTIDCVATDHAPHEEAKKRGAGFLRAAFGIIGLENAFAALYDGLVAGGDFPLAVLLSRMGRDAARVARLPEPSLGPGERAAVVLLRTDASAPVDAEAFASLSRNCPFVGRTLRGRVAGLVAGHSLLLDPTPAL